MEFSIVSQYYNSKIKIKKNLLLIKGIIKIVILNVLSSIIKKKEK